MTKEQVIKVMEYFQAAYKGFYEGKDTREVLTVWHDALADEDPAVVSEAAKNYVRTQEFAPTVAGLMKQIALIKEPRTDTDYWSLINKAARNALYNADEEFKRLPPECQSFIGSPSALKDLAQADTGTMNTIVKGQFLKRVEAIREHQTVQNGLPAEVRMALEESRLKLLGDEYE